MCMCLAVKSLINMLTFLICVQQIKRFTHFPNKKCKRKLNKVLLRVGHFKWIPNLKQVLQNIICNNNTDTNCINVRP